MLINKSMYPVKAGYSAISTMQSQLGKLQTQLGNGQKAQTLAEMGGDRTVSLATRDRLTRLEAFAANIDTVNLRLNFLDQSMTSINKLKSEARTSASPTSYGENGLTMASLQQNSSNRLSQLLETLNLSVAGRYLMGGNQTDKAPVASMDAIMNGSGTQAGYKTVLNERNRADLGADQQVTLRGLGLPNTTVRGPHGNYLTMSSSLFDKIGYEIASVSSNTSSIQTNGPTTNPINQTATLGSQVAAGTAFTVNLAKLNGTTIAPVTLTAVPNGTTPGVGQFELGLDATQTAENFQKALEATHGDLDQYGSIKVTSSALPADNMKIVGDADGSPSIGFKLTDNPSPGETVKVGIKQPDGTIAMIELVARDPASATPATAKDFNIGATRAETMKNLEESLVNQVGALKATVKTGRIEVSNLATSRDTVTISKNDDVLFGFSQITAASTTSPNARVDTTAHLGPPPVHSTSVQFTGEVKPGQSVTFAMKMPDGTDTSITLSAVTGTPGIGQFKIGASTGDTGENFAAALKLKLDDMSKTELVAASTYAAADDFFTSDGVPKRVAFTPPGTPEEATGHFTGAAAVTAAANTVKWYVGEISSTNPRLSATAQVDDSTKVGYGVRANETGLLEMVRTLASMSVQEYAASDPTSKARFSAMVERQMENLSAGTATEKGSVETIALELGVVRSTVGNAASRNTAFSGQLESLLSDVETVSMEETAMQLLALKTRLEASYQTTASVANLSLVNYLK